VPLFHTRPSCSVAAVYPKGEPGASGCKLEATPDGCIGFPVSAIQPDHALVLGGTQNTRTSAEVEPGDPRPDAYFGGDLSFLLQQQEPSVTRLIFRQRLDWNHLRANALIYKLFLEPISFVMGRKMLKGLKLRAESRR
jgi:hypothetical protein